MDFIELIKLVIYEEQKNQYDKITNEYFKSNLEKEMNLQEYLFRNNYEKPIDVRYKKKIIVAEKPLPSGELLLL